jgi:signal transduction histidine kinase
VVEPEDGRRHGLARLLREKSDDILLAYEQELVLADSPLIKDCHTSRQCLAHARQILDNTVETLLDTGDDAPSTALAADIGASRAAAGIHPGESLRAAGLLSTITVRLVGGQLSGAAGVEALTTLALALNTVVTRALCQAADSYASLLLSRVHQAQVEERRRLSRELHDRIGHGISVAMRNLELYEFYRDTEPVRASARVEAAQQSLGETIEGVRQVISDLRACEPMESLEKAIRQFLESAGAPALTSHVKVNGDDTWVPGAVLEETFLIIREALRNVLAHSGASHVGVQVDIAPGELRAVVCDDGRGFDNTAAARGGTGVLSMRERAALLGGILTLTSAPRRGTTVRLVVASSAGSGQ